ncbi:hypothetical protein PG999_002729 [Apiospora kogelbergensis]|uniref:Uncharacterized protein n=1 Tax=Apiospora kogelbergensis TaxID=1337665 RepID=A0AAW0R8Z8_9PEZI
MPPLPPGFDAGDEDEPFQPISKSLEDEGEGKEKEKERGRRRRRNKMDETGGIGGGSTPPKRILDQSPFGAFDP